MTHIMSARSNFEKDLERLNAVHLNPEADGAAAILSRALAAPSNLLVARAAEIIGEWVLTQFVPEMAAAFDRFLADAVRRDPTCAAKFAIADALNRLEVSDDELFRRGIRHVQLEPSWGPPVDTAARLRAVCALGLARSNPPDTLLELAGLLADEEADARTGAVRAIAYAGRPGGAPLLWFKAHTGDAESTVIYECYAALLALESERALTLVAGRAQAADPAQADAALLALGSSRLPAALPLLIAAWEGSTVAAFRRTALTAIATLDSDDGFAFLLDLLANASIHDAADARTALGLFRDDERRRRRIERALRKRDDLPA